MIQTVISLKNYNKNILTAETIQFVTAYKISHHL
jgi:hypothetical protein